MSVPHRLVLIVLALVALAVPATAAAKTRTIRYGPFTVPGMMGMDTGHMTPSHMGAMKTFGKGDLQLPCRDCALTGMRAKLTDPAGNDVNMAGGAMLHHIVLFDQAHHDLMCPTWQERFFASGNERTPMTVPSGYGYRIGRDDRWTAVVDLMNMGMTPRPLYVDVTFTYRRWSHRLRPVRPLWLDINECGDSEYAIPAGRSDTHRDFRSPLAGRLVAVAGHIHDDGIRTTLTNLDKRRTVCTSTAGYGHDPAYKGHIESMTGCLGGHAGRLHRGDRLRLDAVYDTEIAQPDVMGIMLGYVAPRRR